MAFKPIPVTTDGSGPDGAIPVDLHGPGGGGGVGPAGKSAYQTWLDQGNSGSERVYLDSLRGEPGRDGEPGENGLDGADGRNGRDGQEGPPGDRGPAGERGPAGTGIQYAGSYPLLSDLPDDLTMGDAGNFYFTAEFGNVHMWTGSEYVDMAHVVGPEGQPGRDGVDGAPGRDGVDGVDGKDGTPGSRGPAGEVGPPGVGVPAGGSIGQVLAKKTSLDYDTQWVDNNHREPLTVEGSLSAEGSEVTLTLNNVVIAVRNLPVNMHTTGIRTISGEQVVDFRLDTRYDATGNDNFTLDGSVITTTHKVLDTFAYSASRNPSSFLLRENGRLWQGGIFISGVTQSRVTMWAQRIV